MNFIQKIPSYCGLNIRTQLQTYIISFFQLFIHICTYAEFTLYNKGKKFECDLKNKIGGSLLTHTFMKLELIFDII